MGKKIAFIGSSGGNLYKQGGNNLPAMMKEICGQTKAADMEITFLYSMYWHLAVWIMWDRTVRQLYIHGMEQKYGQYFRGL